MRWIHTCSCMFGWLIVDIRYLYRRWGTTVCQQIEDMKISSVYYKSTWRISYSWCMILQVLTSSEIRTSRIWIYSICLLQLDRLWCNHPDVVEIYLQDLVDEQPVHTRRWKKCFDWWDNCNVWSLPRTREFKEVNCYFILNLQYVRGETMVILQTNI